jgi:hypothetical protein
MSALKEQVGGDHYKKQGLQPFEITFANFGYFGLRAAVYTKVNKYLNRDKDTHRKDIQKAIHCLQIQLEFLDRHELEADQLVPEIDETIMHNRRSMDQ